MLRYFIFILIIFGITSIIRKFNGYYKVVRSSNKTSYTMYKNRYFKNKIYNNFLIILFLIVILLTIFILGL
jgi:hypothetical protein